MNIPTRPDVNLVELPVDDISKLGFKFVTPLKEDIEIYKKFSGIMNHIPKCLNKIVFF